MKERIKSESLESLQSGDEILGAAELLSEKENYPLDRPFNPIQEALNNASADLLKEQSEDGHWCFDLEADATIPSEYIFLQFFLERKNPQREKKIGRYLQRKQNQNGSWSLYHDGPGDISASVKSYLALKLLGHSPDEPHMVAARHWIRSEGGAESVNVFTRITLAIFGQMPWRTVPAMPVEIMFLPRWWFFSLSKVSYWSRCVIVPLLIIFAKRPILHLEPEKGVRELFLRAPDSLRNLDRFHRGINLKNVFIAVDRVLKFVEPLIPGFIRNRAIKRAESWMRDHAKGKGGSGAIFPAIANTAMALKLLGASEDDSDLARTVEAIEDLVLDSETESWCQPCVSPVWDTCLSLTALTEAGAKNDHPAVKQAVEWLFDHQIFVEGDWRNQAPLLEPGGWAFQYENDKYPDVDDTGMVLMSLLRAGAHDKKHKIKRINQALNWVLGMQNPDGSWGAFDIGNNCEFLNEIPFADHGALVDPGTADLTARSVELLAMLGYDVTFPAVKKALAFLEQDQEEDGSWYGRWGVNYIYGTWSVLSALGVIGEDVAKPYVRKAIQWLEDTQNEDGGWGESCNTYDDSALAGNGISTASQTAWALLGLMAVGATSSPPVQRGIDYLVRTQNEKGGWDEDVYTGTGFPRVFYLRYDGYSRYFPVWALATYARAKQGLPSRQKEVMTDGPIDLGPLPVLSPTT